MTQKTAKEIYAKLVKTAQDLLENATGQTEATLGPQEAVDGLEEVINDLEVLQEGIPAEPSAEEGVDATEATGEVAAEEPSAEPVAEEEEPIVVAKRRTRKAADEDDKDDDEDKEKDAKIRNLSTQVAKLNASLAKQELEKIAQDYSEAIHTDTRGQQAKFDEVIKSGKTSQYWEARLDAIQEYQDTNVRNDNSYAKPAKNFSSYRVAKQSNISELNL